MVEASPTKSFRDVEYVDGEFDSVVDDFNGHLHLVDEPVEVVEIDEVDDTLWDIPEVG